MLSNFSEKVPSLAILPLSNIPDVLVTVCPAASLFVHLIVVPGATVIVAGVNAISFIHTSFNPGPVPFGPSDPGVSYVVSFEQLYEMIRTAKREIALIKNLPV